MLGSRDKRRRDDFSRTALPHLDALHGLALRLTRNPRDAEDLVQEAYLRAFRFWDRFDTGTNCKAWLFKILHNQFINRYRSGLRDRDLAAHLVLDEEAGAALSPDAVHAARDPERAILAGMFSGRVQAALDALPEEFRIPVILSDLEDLSYREIADVMDCPIGTVMSRLYRGRRLLQAALRGYAEEQGILAQPASSPATDGEAGTTAQVIPLHRLPKSRP